MGNNWKRVKLGEILSEFSTKNRNNENFKVYSVTNDLGFVISTDYFSKEVFSKNLSNYKVIEKGDFAYNPSRVNVGSIDFFRYKDNGLVSPLYVTFKISDRLNESYLKYFLKSNYGLREIRRNTTGSVRDTLNFTQLSRIEIPLPSISEQKNIVSTLDKTDALIEKRKKVIVTLDEYLKSLFLDMFGDPVKNSKGWEKRKLKYFGEIVTGNTPSRKEPDNYTPEYIEWIKTDNIIENKVYINKATEYLSKSGLTRGRQVHKGALLVACIAGSINSIGRSAIADRDVSFNQQINAIQPNESINSIFLYWLFKLCRSYIQEHATKGMKRILTKGCFEKIDMIFPPLKLQEEFSFIVSKYTQVRDLSEVQLDNFKDYFQVMLTDAFQNK